MVVSVNTNYAAMIALQSLNSSSSSLQSTENQISTGLAVANAKDNSSVWAIAQNQRADVSSLTAVQQSLNRAASVADVASSAGQSISDLLVSMRQKVVAAMDTSIDQTSRNALNDDFQSLVKQVGSVIQNASFGGTNILDGSLTSNIQFLADSDATTRITLSVQNMSLGGSIITIPATATISTATAASAMLSLLDASITNTDSSLAELGSQQSHIEAHNTFVSKLMDVLQSGIGNLVDADMAKESAKLQALQVQQQLGAQSLSIANSAPQIVLSLFRG